MWWGCAGGWGPARRNDLQHRTPPESKGGGTDKTLPALTLLHLIHIHVLTPPVAPLEPCKLSQEVPMAWKGTLNGLWMNVFVHDWLVMAPVWRCPFPGSHRLTLSMALGWLSIPSPLLSCSHCSFNCHEKELLSLQLRTMITLASGRYLFGAMTIGCGWWAFTSIWPVEWSMQPRLTLVTLEDRIWHSWETDTCFENVGSNQTKHHLHGSIRMTVSAQNKSTSPPVFFLKG